MRFLKKLLELFRRGRTAETVPSAPAAPLEPEQAKVTPVAKKIMPPPTIDKRIIGLTDNIEMGRLLRVTATRAEALKWMAQSAIEIRAKVKPPPVSVTVQGAFPCAGRITFLTCKFLFCDHPDGKYGAGLTNAEEANTVDFDKALRRFLN